MNKYNLISKIYNFYYKFFLKKNQKYFYLVNRFKFKIFFKNNTYYYNQGYLIKKNFNKTISKIQKKVKQIVVILYNREDPLFSYSINKKKYERLIERNSLNFLKINTQNALSIKFNKNNIIKTFYIKKKGKKN